VSDLTATGPEAAEGHVLFPGDDRLEGVLEWPEAEAGVKRAGGGPGRIGTVAGGVVIAHPYPPGGATMALPVVYRIAQSCRERRLATLRFNFRGVGESLGAFSGTEEYRDVEAAAAFLRGRLASLDGDTVPGSNTVPLALAGYSFGSIMAARAAAGLGFVQALALVGLAVDWPELPPDTFERLGAFRGPVFALCAENDDLGYPEDVERVLKGLGLDYTMGVVEGADHFLEGRHREVGERVAAFLAERLDPEDRAVGE
jgi:alpha/beta superfamily hydrolase